MLFSSLLAVHIGFAALALVAGAVSLAAPKGGRVHRLAGRGFFATMLAMTVLALILALMHDARISIVPSMLTFYLVASGWRTVAVAPGQGIAIDRALTLLALTAAAIGYALGAQALARPTGEDADGFPAIAYYIFASLSLLAAVLDIRLLFGNAPKGLHRLARHAWRLSVAMLIATTSFFQGQQKVFPESLHGSIWLQLPALWVLAVMMYWLARLALRKPPGLKPVAPVAALQPQIPSRTGS